MEPVLYEALQRLRRNVPQLAQVLRIDKNQDLDSWTSIVDAKLLSRLAPDFPIAAAICGGGSSGKSTLFNSLVGNWVSPTGGRAGMNRRVLFAIPAECTRQATYMSTLFEPFQAVPEKLRTPEDLAVPGRPLYIVNPSRLGNLVLMDTPDFDTGAQGSYTNREVTRMALEAADILIYIFTNSNYNNRDNTDFIAQMLTGIGKRKCFLIYRVYPSFAEEEIWEHALTVARAIYSDETDRYVLGIYRADEDNTVAAGQHFMKLRPVRSGGPSLRQALVTIDTRLLRIELLASILADVLAQTQLILDRARNSLNQLQLYRDALQTTQSHCVHEALQHFPMDLIMRRFAAIWAMTDPSPVKILRKTGTLIELPLKLILGAAGWAKEQFSSEQAATRSSKDYQDKVDEDLITASSNLHSKAVGNQIAVQIAPQDPVAKRMLAAISTARALDHPAMAQNPRAESSGGHTEWTFSVDTHPVVVPAQQKLREQDFKSILQAIRAGKDEVVNLAPDLEKELRDLVDRFRNQIGLWGKITQSFWALLNILPATVAVTYVLSTGDPVGAVGIKIKLIGLFGAKDFYALLAIPATTGIKKADQKQLETMLAPIAQTWFNHKLKTVQMLFEQNISGSILRTAQEAIVDAERLTAEIEADLTEWTQGVTKE
ncbi:MAG: dynamin family protein [Desulfobacterales bacterium]|nr:MAG: dynamin family protein [Desulfobacterales bacterium]